MQPSRVFAFAIGTVGVAGDFSMFHASWHDGDIGCGKEKIEFGSGRWAFADVSITISGAACVRHNQ